MPSITEGMTRALPCRRFLGASTSTLVPEGTRAPRPTIDSINSDVVFQRISVSLLLLRASHFHTEAEFPQVAIRPDDYTPRSFFRGVESKVDMDRGVLCSVPKEDPEYPRDGRKICLIICVQETAQPLSLGNEHLIKQQEAKKDVIQETFEGLGYECEVLQGHEETSHKAIMGKLSEYQKQPKDISHFICWLLTYHTESHQFYARNKAISLKDITGSFLGSTFETLVGKPKLFFVDSAYVECTKEVHLADRKEPAQPQSSYLIPTTADFLIGFSPFRQTETEYAEVVCEAVKDHAKGAPGDNFITALDVAAKKLERDDVTSTYISTLTKTFSMSPQR